MQNWLKENWFKVGVLVIGIGLLVVISSGDSILTKIGQNSSAGDRYCVSQKEKIVQEIERNNTQDWDEKLIEVFYSSDVDSCLYVSEVKRTFLGVEYWRVLKRLVDYRSSAGSEPIESCEYTNSALLTLAEAKVLKRGDISTQKMLVDLIKKDRDRISYESYCGEFDKKVQELKK